MQHQMASLSVDTLPDLPSKVESNTIVSTKRRVSALSDSFMIEAQEVTLTGEIWLLRHGQTPWALSGQHTGRSDVKLTDEGVAQAIDAGRRLTEDRDGLKFELVMSSPLSRAHDTAVLASKGLVGGDGKIHKTDGLLEWDYGAAEGRTRDEIAELVRSASAKYDGWTESTLDGETVPYQPDAPVPSATTWDLWTDGPQVLPEAMRGDETMMVDGHEVAVRRGDGETLAGLRARVKTVLKEIQPTLDAGGDVLLVAHSHVLRELTVAWLGLPAAAGRHFELGTAKYAVLGDHKGDHVVRGWGL